LAAEKSETDALTNRPAKRLAAQGFDAADNFAPGYAREREAGIGDCVRSLAEETTRLNWWM
jgi:hypothetical protein